MSVVATTQGYKKNQGMLRPWRSRQFTLLSDGWFMWDKEQAGTRGKCWDLVETVIGSTLTKVNQYFTFPVSFEEDTSLLGFTSEAEAQEWNDMMQEIADENAAGRREWTAGFKDALKAHDIQTRRDLVLKIKPRDWNKEWQFCLRSQPGDGFSMQVRRMKRMYGLWLQFSQYALMLVDAVVHSPDPAEYECVYDEDDSRAWWHDPSQPKMTIYKVGPLIIKVAAQHWSCAKQLQQDMRFLGTFKELYDVFRTLAIATVQGDKYREVQQLKFPLVSTLEARDMRVAVYAQPIGDSHPVGLQNKHVHTLLANLRFTRPAQVLDALAYKELPMFSSIYRNTVSDDIYLMQIQSPYANVLRTSLRPATAMAGCFVRGDVTRPIEMLSDSDLAAMKAELEKSKKGLVHYLNMKGIKSKFELLPYMDLMYFSTDIVSTAINTRATSIVGSKVYGDVVFTFNPDNSRLPLDLKEAFVLNPAAGDIKYYVSMLREPDIASSSVERYEGHIVQTMASTIADFAARLVTLGDAIQEDATMTMQNSEPAVDSREVIYVSDGNHLRAHMRNHGINMCFLPAVLGCLALVQHGTQTLVMSEIVARVAKHILRHQLVQHKDKARTPTAVALFNSILQGLTEASPHSTQFWGVDLPLWCTLGPYSASLSLVPHSVMNSEVYHGRLKQNPAPLYMALLRTLRLTVTGRVIKKLLADGNTLKLPPLEVEDIVSFQKSKLTAAWSNLQHTDLTSFTQQLLHLEKLYQTALMPTRHSTMRQRSAAPHMAQSKGDGYLELFRTVDERVAGVLEGTSDNVEEYGIERSLLANLHKALSSARASDFPAVRNTLTDVQRTIDLLPSHALIPVGVYLVMLFLEMFLIENAAPLNVQSLVAVYIHAWRWLRLLYRSGNNSQLMIESSSHMLSLVVLVKLRKLLKQFAAQNVSIQKFYAMLTLLVKIMPPWQDLAKFLEPKNWFKKVEQHFLGLRTMYLPKPLIHDLLAIPAFDIRSSAFWATNGLAFVEGQVMGMSLDVEQRNIAENHQRDPALHAFSAQTSAQVRNIDLNMLRFPLPMKNTVQFVSCGYRHAAVITTRAELFTLGYGECGRLGHGDENAANQPTRVDYFAGIPVSHASCGREHTMVVTADNRVFGFGWGEAGRLGTGESGKCLEPTELTNVPPVVKVACGREHTLLLCASGQVLACGAGYGGRCGVGSEDDVEVATPVVVDNDPVFVAIDAGECHSAAIDRDGYVYTWGFGGSGALGRGSLENDLVPIQVPLLKAKSVGCGAYHTVAVLLDGTVYGWGDALAGQLGDIAVTLGEMRTSPHKISIGQVTATHVSCGSFTTAILSTAGEVYRWGSPEAGNGAPLNKMDACPLKVEMPDGVRMGALSCGAYQMMVATAVATFSFEKDEFCM